MLVKKPHRCVETERDMPNGRVVIGGQFPFSKGGSQARGRRSQKGLKKSHKIESAATNEGKVCFLMCCDGDDNGDCITRAAERRTALK
jgi:hypothetical protein